MDSASDTSSTSSGVTGSITSTSSLLRTTGSLRSCDSDVTTLHDLSLDEKPRNTGRAEDTTEASKSTFVDLFAVQLEVTAHLLEAEKKKLEGLQRELLETHCDGSYGNRSNYHSNQSVHSNSRDGTGSVGNHGGGGGGRYVMYSDHRVVDRSRHNQRIEQLKLNISRFQQQYKQLQTEYNEQVSGLVRTSNRLNKTSRSQPVTGLKAGRKTRPSIFGTVADAADRTVDSNRTQTLNPQTAAALESFSDFNAILHLGGTPRNSYAHNMVPNPHAHGYTRKFEDSSLVYRDGSLVSGSLDALILHLVPTQTYYPDRTYIFAFLLSSRIYIQPFQLFGQIWQLCISQQNLKSTPNKEALGRFGPHLIQLISEWVELFPYDFRDERLMKQLVDVMSHVVQIYPELKRDVRLIHNNATSKLLGLTKYEDLLVRINQEVSQRLLNIMPNTDIYEICPSPLVLAQQLTHIELERLSMIGSEEFVQEFVKEKEKDKICEDIKKTKNYEAYIAWFNRLSYFVATEICMHLKKKNRVRMIEYFVDVAKECINIGNFNSLMAIIAGMNMAPIQRLKKTWGKLNKDKFEILEHQMNPSSNFGAYRSSLKAALWRSASAMEDRERIVIPFFSLFVKDIYFLNEGCASKLDSGELNFEKFWQLAKQITDFISWKQIECPFDKHPTVLNYLLTNPVFSDNSLSLASFECEPPETSYEKERYKSLKEQAGL